MSDDAVVDGVSVGIRAMIEEARRLGLIWGLRPATAIGSSSVIYDGDVEEMQVISLIGGLDVGLRVMIMFVPPGGNYVIGTLGSNATGRTIRDFVTMNAEGTVSSLTTTPTIVPGIEYEVITTRPGVIWRADWTADFQSINTTATAGICRLTINDTWTGGAQAIFNQANVASGMRVTAGNADQGTFDVPGSYIFRLEVLRSGGADNVLRVNSLHTRLSLMTIA